MDSTRNTRTYYRGNLLLFTGRKTKGCPLILRKPGEPSTGESNESALSNALTSVVPVYNWRLLNGSRIISPCESVGMTGVLYLMSDALRLCWKHHNVLSFSRKTKASKRSSHVSDHVFVHALQPLAVSAS
jgi:hypothetical protein